MKAEPSKTGIKVTTVIPPSMRDEVDQMVNGTGIGLADLLRQGLIRLIKEKREEGRIHLEHFTPLEVAA